MTDASGVAVYAEYDALGRVVETAESTPGHVTATDYDLLGQRTDLTDAEGRGTRYGYDRLGRLITVTESYSATGPTDHQTNVVTEYSYDLVGNLVAVEDGLGHTTVYTYDAVSRRVGERDAVGNVTTYGYDGLGRRAWMEQPDAGGRTDHLLRL